MLTHIIKVMSQIMALFHLLLLVITIITLLFIGKIQRAEFGREGYTIVLAVGQERDHCLDKISLTLNHD